MYGKVHNNWHYFIWKILCCSTYIDINKCLHASTNFQHGNKCYNIRLGTLQVHHFKTFQNASARICLFSRSAKQVPLEKTLIWLSVVKFVFRRASMSMFITKRDVVLDLINFIKRSNALHLHRCQEQILLKMCRRTIISSSTSILPLLSNKSNLVLDVKCMNSTMSTDLILNHHQERRMLQQDHDGVFPLEHMHF